MKLNLKRTLIPVLAAALGLAGCSTEEVLDRNLPNGGEAGAAGKNDLKSVTLSLTGNSVSTRAKDGSVAATQAVTYNGGYLLFVSDQNYITKVMTITTGTNVHDDSSVDISLLAGQDGEEIGDVPGHSTSAWIVGNLPANVAAPAVGGSLTLLKQEIVSFSSQGDIDGVTLFGGNSFVNENGKQTARFSLAPLVARIEIKKIEALTGSDVESFTVNGIFINNYYASVSLEGISPAAAVRNTDENDFLKNSTAYPDAAEYLLYDWNSVSGLGTLTSSSTEYSYVPSTTADSVWAYNLPAPKSIAAGGSLTAPHIVIRLGNVKMKSSSVVYPGEWFLTVSGMTTVNSAGKVKVTSLEPGRVYSIKTIKFGHTNIRPEPEMDTIDVTVAVTLVEWQISDTEVEFGQ
jgi:hypothetical protein